MLSFRSPGRLASVVVGLAAAVAVAEVNRDALANHAAHRTVEHRLPAPETLELLSTGYRQLAADYYWLAGIQYFGDKTNEAEEYRGLGDYLDLVTILDPRFCYAYVFAGEALPYHRPVDQAWSNTRKTLALLRKGAAVCEHEWRVPFLLGYSLFTFTDQYVEAAHFVQQASGQPHAPDYLASLATRLFSQGGELEKALDFAEAKLQTETDPFALSELRKRIAQLSLELDLQQLRKLADDYHARRGVPLRSLQELVEDGALRGIPPDPLGGEFFVDSAGRVESKHEDQLLRLHVHPGGHLREEVVN